MIWQLNPFAIPLQLGALISALIAYASWQRVTVPGRKSFSLFMLSLAIWMFGYGLELTAIPTDPSNVWFAKIEYIGIVLVAPFWLLFLLQYGGFAQWARRRNQLLLFVVPLLILSVIWLAQDQFWPTTSVEQIGSYLIPTYTHSFWYTSIHVPYAYLLFLASAVLLIYIAWRSPSLTRGQGAALVASFIVPFVSNVLYVVVGFSLFPGIDISPFVIITFGLVAAWIIFQLRLLDTAPVAYRAVVHGLPDGVVVLDPRNLVIELNGTAQKIFQRRQHAVHGMPLVQLLPEAWQTAVSAIPATAEKQIELSRTSQTQTETFALQVAPLYDRRQRFIGRVLVFRDITASKQATAALFASQQRLQTVVSSAPIAIFACDAAGMIRTVAGNEIVQLELHPETLIGRSAYELFANSDELIHNLNRALSGETFTTTFTVRGQIYELWYKPAYDEHAVLQGTIVVGVNITERKKVEQALQESQRLESIGLLAGGIAHDFNNLLASVMGQASLAVSYLPEDHQALPHLQLTLDGVERAAELTRQLLAYAGKGKFEQRLVDLNELLRNNVELLQTTVSTTVQLQLALSAAPATVLGDRGQLQQIIMNLTLNAAEAIGGHDGVVTIYTARQQIDPSLMDSGWRGQAQLVVGDYVLLEVQDTGSGISDEAMARLFEPFFTTKPMGRGLGLSATLGIIQAHGGAINIHSEPGIGTTFSVLLPFVVAPERPFFIPSTASPIDVSQFHTVLVVDDEASVRQTLRDMLMRHDIRVLEAANGRLALDLFTQHQHEITLIFLDMQMPIMDGAETFKQLRQMAPELKVIVTSGYSESEAMASMAQDERVDFIQKPFRMRQLLAKMQSMAST